MSQAGVAPTPPGYSSGSPPDYKATAADTERVIASAASNDRSPPPFLLARPTLNHSSIVHSNAYILVILPRPGHTSSTSTRTSPSLLAYGRQATISGLLSLTLGRWTSTISKVAVSLTGQASSVLIRRGTREPASSKKLLCISQVLWSNNTPQNTRNSPSPDKSIKFELQFPESVPDGQKGRIDLPPTFDEKTQVVFGLATHVKIEYRLRVDVWRRGLRSHKRYVPGL